jgi:hypothetical protein
MKTTLRLIALAGTTFFGVISAVDVATLVYIYIHTYQIMPHIFPLPGYHRFPIYRLNRDMRDVAPIIFAFLCCLICYLRLAKPEKPK